MSAVPIRWDDPTPVVGQKVYDCWIPSGFIISLLFYSWNFMNTFKQLQEIKIKHHKVQLGHRPAKEHYSNVSCRSHSYLPLLSSSSFPFVSSSRANLHPFSTATHLFHRPSGFSMHYLCASIITGLTAQQSQCSTTLFAGSPLYSTSSWS